MASENDLSIGPLGLRLFEGLCCLSGAAVVKVSRVTVVARDENIGMRDVQGLDVDGKDGFEGDEDGQFRGDTKIIVVGDGDDHQCFATTLAAGRIC
jgi:hypothetical protein